MLWYQMRTICLEQQQKKRTLEIFWTNFGILHYTLVKCLQQGTFGFKEQFCGDQKVLNFLLSLF